MAKCLFQIMSTDPNHGDEEIMDRGQDDLRLLIQSRIPIIIIESHEEKRVLRLIQRLAATLRKPFHLWTVIDGLRMGDNAMLYATESPKNTAKPEAALMRIKDTRNSGIYVLCDFHPYFENAPQIVRLLKEIAIDYDFLGHTVILLSGRIEPPEELRHFIARFDLPMPDEAEIERIIREEANAYSRENPGAKVSTNQRVLRKMIRSLTGLPTSDARRLARNAIYKDGAIAESDIPEVNRAKFELLGMDGVLSFDYETASFADVGGLKSLKAWLEQREAAFYDRAGDMGLDPPKGIMLLGVQGSGKSLAAKAVAGVWGVPLLRLDFGAIFNKFFGESERNLREALKIATLMAPCVLWIDEIEKGLAGDAHDSGTSQRVLGTLLTWMAERKTAVFVVATSNDISALPPELVRKGRLDEIFFVDLPGEAVRRDIFRIHLEKRKQPVERFDLDELARLTDGFSGAEIEQGVVAALYHAVARKKQLKTRHLFDEIERTRPLSVVMAEKITALREWAKGRTVPADEA